MGHQVQWATLTTKWLEDQVWMKISDILANPDKLREVIQESLGILKGRQAELDSILNRSIRN